MSKQKKKLIISASRRTDIPAFYAKWFINRIRAGYCAVPNPYNKKSSKVSLAPEDVSVIVFWSRYPRTLMRYLDELDKKGYKYYFQWTLMDNPREIDPHLPALENRIETFRELAERVGSERVIWRYDPIVISPITPPEFHIKRYRYIAQQLQGYTKRSIISIVDEHYKKIQRRFQLTTQQYAHQSPDRFGQFVQEIASIAKEHGMEIQSCAEDIDLAPYGVPPGKCIDDELIRRVFGIEVSNKKDKGQRDKCGCVESCDIGVYNTCLYGCVYCYATSSFDKARENFKKHNPDSDSLVGCEDVSESSQQQHEVEQPQGEVEQQLELF